MPRLALPGIIHDLNVKTMLDAPCGDFGWLSSVALGVEQYFAADIVADLIVQNSGRHARADREFLQLDITRDELPSTELILCRDCLVHLSITHIQDAIRNFRRGGAQWLLTTTFPGTDQNMDIEDGDWRCLNFEKPPFSLPAPVLCINEECEEAGGAYRDKSLGLWPLSSLYRDRH